MAEFWKTVQGINSCKIQVTRSSSNIRMGNCDLSDSAAMAWLWVEAPSSFEFLNGRSSRVQFGWACVHCSIRFPFLTYRNRSGTWCWNQSIRHIWVICDAFPLTKDLKIAYLWNHSLPVSLKQSGDSPLTFSINKGFLLAELQLSVCFLSRPNKTKTSWDQVKPES